MPDNDQEKKPEVKETEEGGVEVSLEEEKDEVINVQDEEVKEVKPEVKEVPKQDPFKNKVYAQDRIIEKQNKKIAELESKIEIKEPGPEPLDDLDKEAQTDWKSAVSKLAAREAKKIYEENQKQIQIKSQETERAQILQSNEQKVLSKYPELNEQTSEHTQIWFDVLNKNPRWRTSPEGPILVMREMEDVLRSKGYDIDGRATKEVKQERDRLIRANATSLDTPRNTPSNKVILSKEQREFCDINGLSYEEYARTLKKSGERGLEL